MEQKVLQRKVNYIAPTLNTETESETAYRQIRVAAYYPNGRTAQQL